MMIVRSPGRGGCVARGIAFIAVVAAWLALAAWPSAAQTPIANPAKPDAERRIALVIGNGAYLEGSTLANPVNDARAIGAKLRKLGFDVIAVENGSKHQMERALASFSNKLGPDAVSLFYYAGHGMQVNGHNYLIPVDAQISTEQTVRLETVDVDAVIDQMSMAKSRVNLVILDACRINPYERRFRSRSGGLASIEAPTGTLIAYATSPGKVAADGAGSNGLYTSELLAAIGMPGAKVEDVFKRVRVGVTEKSRGEQTPWESTSLTGDFYFNGPSTVILSPSPAGMPADRDSLFWTSVKDSNNPAQIQAYLDQFPQGTFAGLAKVMLEDLKRSQVATLPVKPGGPSANPAEPRGDESNTNTSGTQASKYLGCFKDEGNPLAWLVGSWTEGRDIDGAHISDPNMTIARCVEACGSRGYIYAGVQYGNQCFCGNRFGSFGSANNCDIKCAGNSAEICGGTWANSVYSAPRLQRGNSPVDVPKR